MVGLVEGVRPLELHSLLVQDAGDPRACEAGLLDNLGLGLPFVTKPDGVNCSVEVISLVVGHDERPIVVGKGETFRGCPW